MKATKSHPEETMKGHMALNSSPFKPSINKLSSQFLIQDQMMSHYYNLATIKSAIDSTPPKSTSLSIKKRDQMKRDALLKKIYGGISPRSKTPNKLQKSVSETGGLGTTLDATTRNYPFVDSRPTTSRSWAPSRKENFDNFSRTSRPATSNGFSSYKRNTTGKLSPRGVQNSTKTHVLDVTYSGDYLDKHEERFHNANNAPFTPRTKKRPGKSFLSQSKHYAPPLQSSKPKQTEKKKSASTNRGGVTKENIKKLDEDAESDSRSSDHQRWIEEQSEYVQRLSLIEQEERERASKRASPCASSVKSGTRRRIEEEEKELVYLEFVNEVTNDILSRGIYSDSVLNQVMERHVERRSHDLEVSKMWKMLKKLKFDLGITNLGTHGSYTVGKSNHSDDDLEEQRITTPLDRISRSSSTRSHSVMSEHTEPKLNDLSSDKGNPMMKSIPGEASPILGSHPSDQGSTEVDNVVMTSSLVSVSSIPSEGSTKAVDMASQHFANTLVVSEKNAEVKALKPILKSSSKESFAERSSPGTTKRPNTEVESTTTEEGSEYESIVALSTVLKPPEEIRPSTPLLSESRTVIVDQTGASRFVSRDVDEALKIDEEERSENYSDDFHEDSGDDF